MPRKPALPGPAPATEEAARAVANDLLIFDFPQRVERFDCPAPYQAHHLTVVVNQPDVEVTNRSWADLFADAIQSWTFRLKDGKAAPISAPAVVALPPDLFEWLKQEWQERRQAPLVSRKNGSAAPTTSNGRGTPTPPTAD